MRRIPLGLLLAIVLAWATPVQAQLLFNRKPKQNAWQRVPELILTLKTESDERKRLAAVEELREYDAATYSEIVPVLVEVLQNDKKMNMRLEAVNALTKVRPIQPLVAQAIDKAAHEDESWRVRWQAKTSLTKLQVAGMLSKKEAAPKKNGNEPPLNDAPLPPNTIVVEPLPMTPAPTVQPPSGPSIPRPLPRSVAPAPITPLPGQTPAPPVLGPALFP